MNNTKTSWIFKFFSSSAYSYILFVVCFSFFLLFLFTSMTTLLLFHIVDAYWDLPRFYSFLWTGSHFAALTLHLESSCVWLKSLEKWKWLQILPYSSCGEMELIFLTWTWAGLWQLCSVDCGRSDNHASFGCVWELEPSLCHGLWELYADLTCLPCQRDHIERAGGLHGERCGLANLSFPALLLH